MVQPRHTSHHVERVPCPVCGVKVREDNLAGHMERIHPDGEATEAAREAQLKRRLNARRSAAKQTLRRVAPVAGVALLLILVAYFAFIYETPPERPPDWKLTDIDGQTTYDSKDYYKEGLTLVEFMHTECPNCRDMAPILQDLFEKHQGNLSGMFTIGGYILHNDKDTPVTIRNFRDEHGSQWVHLYDPSGNLMRDYGTNSYPTIYFIKDDRIVYTQVGKTSSEFLEKKIEQYT